MATKRIQATFQPPLPPPTNEFYYIDGFLIYHYGRKSGINSDEVLISILCYVQQQLVAHMNFFPEPHVPAARIEADPNTPKGYRLWMTFPIDRAAEVIDTLRQSQTVSISVDTAQGISDVGGLRAIGKQIP
ncbi:MAG TPA: hypothetical protein VKB95_01555 [Chitinophagaceae bacterium]|nr:hypothetical protein [Chitinophagaceae bacterium]